jgi:hypothetical protein
MATGVLEQISSQLGISIWILIVIAVWSLVWKLIALWKSARKRHLAWFIVLALVNTVGILEILYVYIFSDIKYNKSEEAPKRKRR